MDRLYAPQNIKILADNIVAAVNTREDDRLDALLNVMKVLNSGPPGERCQSFYGSRVPADRCLAAVLSSPGVQSGLAADAGKCKELLDILLGLPYLTSHHCRALGFLLPCTQGQPDLRMRLVGGILGHNDLCKFELKTILASLKEDTSELEMSLIRLCTLPEPTAEHIQAGWHHWIRWCARSPDIFQVVTGLLHELLKLLKCKTRVLECTSLFVKLVRELCDRSEIDFVSLYPCEVQTLVGLLLLAPSDKPEELFQFIKKEVQSKMFELQFKDPSTALLLITHFPEWNDVLQTELKIP